SSFGKKSVKKPQEQSYWAVGGPLERSNTLRVIAAMVTPPVGPSRCIPLWLVRRIEEKWEAFEPIYPKRWDTCSIAMGLRATRIKCEWPHQPGRDDRTY